MTLLHSHDAVSCQIAGRVTKSVFFFSFLLAEGTSGTLFIVNFWSLLELFTHTILVLPWQQHAELVATDLEC